VKHQVDSIASSLEWAVNRLRQQGIENPRLDAEVLLAFSMNADRANIYRDAGAAIEKGCRERFRYYIARRVEREPVAYITGIKEFRSLAFRVSSDVLIPRPETETIIDVMLQVHHAMLKNMKSPLRVLEVGTGSGIIAVSLAKEIDKIWISATDYSASIVAVARSNAQLNRLDHKICFLVGDLLNPLKSRDEADQFDCILSNPPYLSDEEWNSAQPEIKRYEPERALRSGPDGLSFYRDLVPETGRLLRKNGFVLFEIGRGQAVPVAHLIEQTGLFGPVSTAADLSGIKRVIMAQKR
jgi:release factor glutamine methyltransferase